MAPKDLFLLQQQVRLHFPQLTYDFTQQLPRQTHKHNPLTCKTDIYSAEQLLNPAQNKPTVLIVPVFVSTPHGLQVDRILRPCH